MELGINRVRINRARPVFPISKDVKRVENFEVNTVESSAESMNQGIYVFYANN